MPIFGFGVLLAIWAVATAATMIGLARRHGWGAETWSALPMLLLLGAAIVLLPRVFPEGLPIRGYGLMLLAGIVAGVAVGAYRARQGGVELEISISIAIWLVVSGVIGARLFYVVEYWDEKFAGRSPGETLLEIINIPQGGLVIYGGLFGAAVGFVAVLRKYRLPLLAMADVAAPAGMIGLALGRIGCLLNGCCYGGQTDWPWAVTFPQYSSRYDEAASGGERPFSPPYADQAARGELYGFRMEKADGAAAVVGHIDDGSPADAAGLRQGDVVRAVNGKRITSFGEAKLTVFSTFTTRRPLQLSLDSGRTVRIPPIEPPPRSRPVHPTQVYSAVDAALIAWLLWAYFPLRRRDGECLALLLTIHPITRFLLEVIRTDEPAVFGTGLSISQNISLLLLVLAAGLWWYLSRRPRGVTWPLVATGPASRSGTAARPMTTPAAAGGERAKPKPGARRPAR